VEAQPEPLEDFSRCHLAILDRLKDFGELPALLVAAERGRRIAEQTIAMFEPSVLDHHADEEADLFPAVLRSALPGPEADWVAAMVHRLTGEHRSIEARWADLKAGVKAGAAGKHALLDPEAVQQLVSSYTAHARFEEEHFLPLAHQILGRDGNHMAALGVSLHMRHAKQPVGYI
jgi:hypothetical protein